MQNVEVNETGQIKDLLEWALADNKTISVAGNNSKAALGRPMDTDVNMSVRGLQGVEMYEAAELVMKAKAGTLLDDILKTLDDSNQKLAFIPPDYGPLLGGEAGQATIGGTFACNLSGSDRIKNGGARDHLLGAEGFTGWGHAFKTGSRVMKNVTGYDLCKLVAGSYGTLAVCTSLTFKVLPRAEKVRTVLIYGEDVKNAVATLRDAMSSVHEVSAAAFLPADIAARSGVDFVKDANTAVVALKIEGPAPSAEFRCNALKDMFASRGNIEELHSTRSRDLWSFVRNVSAFVEDQSSVVWRVSVPPASAPAYVADLKRALPDAEYFLDWAGGLVWVSLPSGTAGAGAEHIRGAIKDGGHATLIRASKDIRLAITPFQPQDVVQARISEKIREGFDPQRILNPGRMYAF
jgi:glycolate dehydrogenase FAD-binding subunit